MWKVTSYLNIVNLYARIFSFENAQRAPLTFVFLKMWVLYWWYGALIILEKKILESSSLKGKMNMKIQTISGINNMFAEQDFSKGSIL